MTCGVHVLKLWAETNLDARAMCRKVARTELRNDTVSVPVRPNPTPQDPDAVTLPRVSISRDSQLATPLTRSRSSRQPWTRCRMYLVRLRLIIVTPSAFPCTLAKKCSSYTALMADLARQTTTLFLRVVPSPCFVQLQSLWHGWFILLHSNFKIMQPQKRPFPIQCHALRTSCWWRQRGLFGESHKCGHESPLSLPQRLSTQFFPPIPREAPHIFRFSTDSTSVLRLCTFVTRIPFHQRHLPIAICEC